jgi:hypothetical protein
VSVTRLDHLFDAISRPVPGRRSASRRDAYTGAWSDLAGGFAGGFANPDDIRSSSQPTLSPQQIEALLAHSWRARQEIVQWGGDLIREGVELEGLPEWVDPAAVQSWLEGDDDDGTDGLLGSLGELWMEGESYGGAIEVAVLDDGLPPSAPVDLGRVNRVISWEVLDRWCVWPYRRRMGGPVDYWVIGDHRGELAEVLSVDQIVHPSRVVVHPGSWMPRRWRIAHNGWGISRLEITAWERAGIARGLDKAGELLSRASQDVIALAELSEAKAAAGDPYVNARMAEIRKTLDAAGLLILDGGIKAGKGGSNDTEERLPDQFQTVARPMTGAGDLVKTLHSEWRMGIRQPEVIADGTASGGLNTGAEAGQWRSYAGSVSAEQRKHLTAKLNWGLRLIFASKEGPTGGQIPDDWTAKWRKLAEDDHEVEARVAEIYARIDELYQRIGVLTAEQIKQWRSVDGKSGIVQVPAAIAPIAQPVVVGALEQPADPIAPEQPDVQAQALNGAQITSLMELSAAVVRGEMPVEVALWLIGLAVPGLDTSGAAMAMAIAETWAGVQPATSSETGLAAEGVEQETDADLDLDGDGEPDPLDVALAEIPTDLMTPSLLVEQIKAATGLEVSTQRVHALAKRYAARRGKIGGEMGYSLADIKAAILRDNGIELPQPAADAARKVVDAFALRLDTRLDASGWGWAPVFAARLAA